MKKMFQVLTYNGRYDSLKADDDSERERKFIKGVEFMKKRRYALKMISAMLAVCAVTSVVTGAYAKSEENGFVTIKIPFPETIEERDSWRTAARYTDTKECISLSEYYDGYVWATVPERNKNRGIEACVPKSVSFAGAGEEDCFDISWLSRTGVMVGNEKGEAEPMRNITRAEAVAMIMRFIGLENDPEAYQIADFEDVSKEDWFYSAVMSAYKCGIAKGDSEKNFAPKRNITREEFVCMTANAIKYAGLGCPAAGDYKIEDENEVSEWAKSAYKLLGAAVSYDYKEDETDWENPTMFLNPQKEQTRQGAANLLYSVERICQNYPSELATIYGFDKEMPVIDGSTSTHPFTIAVYQNLFSNGLNHQQFPRKHSKSHSSYERLINGEVDMLFASVYPASDITELAESKGVELELIPIAYDAMIFFTNAENPIKGLTQEQITNIYVNDSYDNWAEVGGSDALLYPYCRNNDSGSHAQMEKHFLKGREIHPEVQKETSYTMSNVLTDVMGAKTDDPTGYGLGYSIYYYFQNMDLFYDTNKYLKLLEIDGVMPTDENIASGEYPLSNNTYIVLRKDTPENSPTRKMAEFILTEAGQACVGEAGFGKLIG